MDIPSYELIFVKGFDILDAVKGVKHDVYKLIDDCLINKLLKDNDGNGFNEIFSSKYKDDNSSHIFNNGIIFKFTKADEGLIDKSKYKNCYQFIIWYWPVNDNNSIYKKIADTLYRDNHKELVSPIHFGSKQFVAEYFLYW